MASLKLETTTVCIDIDATTIRVIDVRKGKVQKIGQANIPKPETSKDGTAPDYASILTETLKTALKQAKIANSRANIVLGGPNIIIRRIEMPMMAKEAMKTNAVSEIGSYLPSAADQYQIDYKLLEETIADDGSKTCQVLVAAVPTQYVENMVTIVKRAGMRVGRVDIRESVREKLIRNNVFWGRAVAAPPKGKDAPPSVSTSQKGAITIDNFPPNASFAILDVNQRSTNVTVFVNGHFYINRYIGGEDGKSKSADDLVSEIGSIIDYTYYRERNYKVETILLYGLAGTPESKSLADKLHNDLGLSVVQPGVKLKNQLPGRTTLDRTINLAAFLDVYAGAVDEDHDVNFAPKQQGGSIGIGSPNRKFILSGVGVAVAALVIVGSALPVYNYYKKLGDLEKIRAQIIQNVPPIVENVKKDPTYGKVEADRKFNDKKYKLEDVKKAADAISKELGNVNGIVSDYVGFSDEYEQPAEFLKKFIAHTGGDVIFETFQYDPKSSTITAAGYTVKSGNNGDERLQEFVKELIVDPDLATEVGGVNVLKVEKKLLPAIKNVLDFPQGVPVLITKSSTTTTDTKLTADNARIFFSMTVKLKKNPYTPDKPKAAETAATAS